MSDGGTSCASPVTSTLGCKPFENELFVQAWMNDTFLFFFGAQFHLKDILPVRITKNLISLCVTGCVCPSSWAFTATPLQSPTTATSSPIQIYGHSWVSPPQHYLNAP